MKKPTANNFIALLESTHLIHRLPPFGYGKEVLRARYKVYLADAAIAPSVMLKGKSLLEDAPALGVAVETAFFNHVFTRYYRQSIGFSYWKGRKDQEVDIIASVEGRLIPFEVKYRSQATGAGDLKGLEQFCADRKVDRGYVITKDMNDFSIMPLASSRPQRPCGQDPGAARLLLARPPGNGGRQPKLMNEAETRAEHIDPALKAAGWGVVEGSRIRREYPITPGRIEGHGRRGKPLIADYVLVTATQARRGRGQGVGRGADRRRGPGEELRRQAGHPVSPTPPTARASTASTCRRAQEGEDRRLSHARTNSGP